MRMFSGGGEEGKHLCVTDYDDVTMVSDQKWGNKDHNNVTKTYHITPLMAIMLVFSWRIHNDDK